MKKILITLLVYLLSSNVLIASENDCTELKKLSKEYLACKAKNIKDGAKNVNNKIKEGSANKTEQIKEGTKNLFNKIKNKIKKD